jgi:hypothetical protein
VTAYSAADSPSRSRTGYTRGSTADSDRAPGIAARAGEIATTHEMSRSETMTTAPSRR